MANPWIQLRRLLPKEPMQVGTIEVHHPDGTSTVALVGGGHVRVRGQEVPVGNQAYVKAGAIAGPAPDLAAVTIDV